MTHIYHAKFRWTENLTLKFIRLRKENGKLFTGRKYSAQAGWEHILRQMKVEFPTIMADVHYRVLKKKWSNLLQQYKELKNPVHGDKNNADDVSWPFYSAIDEIVSSCNKITQSNQNQQILYDNQIDPHQFLYVSVNSDEQPEEEIAPCSSKSSTRSKRMNGDLPDVTISSRKCIKDSPALDTSQVPLAQAPLNLRANTYGVKTKIQMTPLVNVRDVTKLRRTTTENRSRVPQQQQQQQPQHQQLHIIRTTVNHVKRTSQSLNRDSSRLKRLRKTLVQTYPPTSTSTMLNVNENHSSELIRKLNEFIVYTKRRDEEHRIIMIRILESVEKIANKID
ncbi:uncharacterized protein LOC123266266 [Cotesia glomerata]|uniref:Myb/SANT-like DNA-binding domain-containing protein n=1 Tax=Cotesia glomerata TaxID=32391 RepID=A0AAV7IWC1_COTGL|nr:uncharacterized protein LOC123266266 [Cotesia glomerata]KAH0561487.1 hypothetical protein KQX54_017075 [Cotesia glomerata]